MQGTMDDPRRTRAGRLRRARAAVATALAAALGLQGGWQDAGGHALPGPAAADAIAGNGDGPDRRTDAPVRLREAVEREAARLRASLDAAEQGQDYSGLVRRKLTVDAALVPLHLVRDAIEFAGGQEDCDLLRSLRAEWRPDRPRSRWSHAGAADRARRSLASALGIGPGGTLRLHARMALVGWNGTDAPPLVDWQVEGTVEGPGPAVVARCIRVLPAFDAEHVGFPLPCTGFELRWDGHGARYADDGGTHHEERWRPDACFDNPADVYAVFDGLRLAGSGDRGCRAAATAADEVRSMPISSVRTIDRADGTELRRERWDWEGDALRSIEWTQAELSVLHRSPQAALIVAEEGGEVVSRTEHRAEAAIRVPAIEATLRWTGPGEASFAMQVDGEDWAVGTLRTEALAAHAGTPATLGVREVGEVLERALRSDDANELGRALDAVEALHASVDAPIAQRSAQRELLALRLVRAGRADLARALLVGRWLRDLRAGEAEAAIERWCVAGEATLAGMLAQAAGRSDGGDRAAADAGPCPRAPATATQPIAACDPERLAPACARFARCLAGAATAVSPPRHDARRLDSAICAACSRGEVPELGDDALESLAAEARAAAGAHIGVGDGPGADGEDRFVALAIEAAARDRCSDAVLAAMRRSWRAIELEAAAALRALDAHEAIAALQVQMHATGTLLGNRFAPGLDAAAAADPPAAGALRDVLRVRIGAAIESERRRAKVADAILDRTLAQARRNAMPGRVARAAAAAAMDEYVRWTRATRAPGSG